MKGKRLNVKKQKGVTLIALVVTIVVLIILATISINSVINEDGLLHKVLSIRDEEANLIANDDDELVKTKSEYANVMRDTTTIYIDNSLITPPKISNGMTPVKWNGSNWVKTTITDSEWYDYEQKEWANVVLEDATFDETTGVLDENKAYSMLVWIPRYAYKITSGWHQDSTQLAESGGAGTISVIFVDTNNKAKDGTIYDATYAKATVDAETTYQMSEYVQHPAFTFGTEELEGFWVGKYESSNTDGATGYDESYVMQIKPNVTSWRNISISDIYTVCREMNKIDNPYNLDTSDTNVDSHLMKNTEWGAVAYLSKSSYGKEAEEIYINNSSTHITGTAGASASEANTGTSYSYPNSNAASTTGNIYGVFDMSGGAWEYVAGYINNSYIKDINTEQYQDGNRLIMADKKYKDVYTIATEDLIIENYETTINKYGDAMYEVTYNRDGQISGWHEDCVYFAYTNEPYIVRGGGHSRTTLGGIFSVERFYGKSGAGHSFRVAIPVL